MKTYSPKPDHIEHRWYVMDASGQVLGRLATEVATILRGKHKPIYATHADVGDHVIVINAEKIKVSGRKVDQKRYHRHTGYPGGLRTTAYRKLQAEHPDRIIKKAIWGMLPHNILGRQMFRKLRVYAGGEHQHAAQKPQALEV